MLVALLTVGVGGVCLYHGARALRIRRTVRRLRAREAVGPSHPTDWPAGSGDDDPREGAGPVDGGSLERGVVLLMLGACCILFGALAV